MDLTLIRSLLAVAEAGVISEAARKLHVSQSALSRRIHQLEQEFGVALLERQSKGVALTEMGRLAVDEGQSLIERYERLRASLRAHERLGEGTVRIGGGATAVSFILPDSVARFHADHPKLRIELREAGSSDIERAVVGEELELGLVTLPLREPELESRLLVRDRIVLVAGPDHPIVPRRNASLALAQLDGQNLVGFEAGSAIRKLIDGALRDARVFPRVVMELRSIGAILQMVERTPNLAFVSELGIDPRNRRVRVIALRDLELRRSMALVWKRERPLSPGAAAFAKLLSASVEPTRDSC